MTAVFNDLLEKRAIKEKDKSLLHRLINEKESGSHKAVAPLLIFCLVDFLLFFSLFCSFLVFEKLDSNSISFLKKET